MWKFLIKKKIVIFDQKNLNYRVSRWQILNFQWKCMGERNILKGLWVSSELKGGLKMISA